MHERAHRLIVIALVVAVATLLSGCGPRTDTDRTKVVESPARDVSAWVTSADGESRLADLAPDDAIDPGVIVTADRDSARQTIDGFGAAVTHSSAALLMAMSAPERDALLRELFDPDGEVRLNVVRVPFGGSDFVAEPAYTFNDLPPGEEDWDLDRFSTDADEAALRPALREILAISPEVRVIASPWSPPAWMKDSGSLEGGRLRDEDRVFETYASYLHRAVEEYAAAGVPVQALTVQNEPQAAYPDGYPGTDMPVADQIRLIRALGPMLEGSGTGILAYDHNWSLHPSDAAASADPEPEYPTEVLASDAAPWVSGVAFHCYSGDATRQSALHEQFPGTPIHVTECSGSHAPDEAPEQIFAGTLSWQARNLLVASLGNWASSVLTWNLVLDPDGGPHIGGCGTCTGVVTVAPDGAVTRNAEYYVLAHAARWVPRGSTTLNTATEGDSALSHTGFRTPSGSVVLLVYNDADDAVDTAVQVGEVRSAVTIPGRSLVTVQVRSAAFLPAS